MDITQSDFAELKRRQSLQDFVGLLEALEADGEILIVEDPATEDESEGSEQLSIDDFFSTPAEDDSSAAQGDGPEDEDAKDETEIDAS